MTATDDCPPPLATSSRCSPLVAPLASEDSAREDFLLRSRHSLLLLFSELPPESDCVVDLGSHLGEEDGGVAAVVPFWWGWWLISSSSEDGADSDDAEDAGEEVVEEEDREAAVAAVAASPPSPFGSASVCW